MEIVVPFVDWIDMHFGRRDVMERNLEGAILALPVVVVLALD